MSGAVEQQGPVVPGHVAVFYSNGAVMDGGGASAGAVTELGITNGQGLAVGINSGIATGPFTQLGFEVGTNGSGTISLNSFNGAPAPNLDFIVNGVTYSLGRLGGGNVVGPSSAIAGDVVSFNGTTGELVQDTGLPASAIIPAVSSISALQLSSSSSLPVGQCYVLGYSTGADGGEGVFWYNAADTTSADNGGTIIVDQSNRRWYRETGGQPYSVLWFGAKGNGTTDDTSAITRLLNVFNTVGGVCYFPPGVYLYTPPLIIPASTLLLGADRSTSVLLAAGSPSVSCVVLGVAAGIAGLKLAAQAQAVAGAMVFIGTSNGAFVRDFIMVNYFIGISIAGVLGTPVVGTVVTGGSMTGGPEANVAVAYDFFSDATLEDMVIVGPLAGPQPPGSVSVRAGDTMLLSRINATLHGTFKIFPQAGENCFGVRISDCFWDSANTGDACTIAPSSGSGIFDITIENTWFGLSNGNGLDITDSAGGTVDGLQLSNCEFVSNLGGDGLIIGGPGISNVVCIGGLASGNSGDGILLETGCNNITIANTRCGNGAFRGPNGGFGIATTGAVNFYIIQGCNTQGNVLGGLSDTATGSTKSVTGNI